MKETGYIKPRGKQSSVGMALQAIDKWNWAYASCKHTKQSEHIW